MSNAQFSKVQQKYDKVAATYDDDYNAKLVLSGDRLVMKTLAKEIQRYRSRNPSTDIVSVVDVGMGTGILPEYIDPVRNNISYFGFDASKGMLDQARKKQRGKNPKIDPSLTFIEADMHYIPMADGEADIIASIFGPPSYSMQPDIFFTEVARIAHPGSQVFLMPLTARVGAGVTAANGFSVAFDDTASLLYYNSKTFTEKLSDNGFGDIITRGVNFTGQLVQEFVQMMTGKRDIRTIACYLKILLELAHRMRFDPRYHKLDELNDALREMRELADTLRPSSGSTSYSGPGYAFLKAEKALLGRILDAGLARHMIVTATKL